MKKILLFIGILAVILPGLGYAQSNAKQKTKLNVYYFHSKNRCPTCLAIEKETKDLLNTAYKANLANSSVKFLIIDIEDSKNEELVKKYDVWGSSLILVNDKGKKTDLTEDAFAYARNEAPKFRKILTETIDKQLK
jgi:disulfide oxidoreductase YuzD